MNITFLNMWGGEREEELLAFVKQQSLHTNVFCFQEFSDAMPTLSGETLIDYTKIEFRKHRMSQAIFVRKNIPIVASGPLLQDDHFMGSGGYVQIQHGDTDLYICNVHGWPYPGDKKDDAHRLKQSGEIIDFFRKKRGLKIIGGDFNLLPETESVKMFTENGYRNLIEEFNIQTTRNHLAWDKYPLKQYFADYVFVSPEMKVKNFLVPALEISDHLPLILETE